MVAATITNERVEQPPRCGARRRPPPRRYSPSTISPTNPSLCSQPQLSSAGDCDPITSAPALHQPLLFANAVQRLAVPLGMVNPLEGGEAHGRVTDGWRHAAPASVLDNTVGSKRLC